MDVINREIYFITYRICVSLSVSVFVGCVCVRMCVCAGVLNYISSSIPIPLRVGDVLIPHLGQHEPTMCNLINKLSTKTSRL